MKWFKENSCQKLSTFNLYEGTVKVLFETEYNNLNRESKTLNKLLFDQRSNPSKPGSAGAPPPPMPPMPPIMDVKNCMNFRIIPKVLAFLSINLEKWGNNEKHQKFQNKTNSNKILPLLTNWTVLQRADLWSSCGANITSNWKAWSGKNFVCMSKRCTCGFDSSIKYVWPSNTSPSFALNLWI